MNAEEGRLGVEMKREGRRYKRQCFGRVLACSEETMLIYFDIISTINLDPEAHQQEPHNA